MSPNINDLKSSKFLTQNDVEPPKLVTIKSYEEIDVSMESQPTELKWTLMFNELDKPLVLNFTNGQNLMAITGSEDFEDWIGQKVVLYNDKTVSFGNKITGGIRIRASLAAKAQQLTAEEQAAQEVIDSADEADYGTPATDADVPAEDDKDVPF